MISEEAIEYLNTLYMALAVFPNQQISLGDIGKMKESVSMAIKTLEQESILDKIRAEIENHCGLTKENHCRYCSYCNNVMGVREILEIFNKYRAEGSDE